MFTEKRKKKKLKEKTEVFICVCFLHLYSWQRKLTITASAAGAAAPQCPLKPSPSPPTMTTPSCVPPAAVHPSAPSRAGHSSSSSWAPCCWSESTTTVATGAWPSPPSSCRCWLSCAPWASPPCDPRRTTCRIWLCPLHCTRGLPQTPTRFSSESLVETLRFCADWMWVPTLAPNCHALLGLWIIIIGNLQSAFRISKRFTT